MPRPLLARIDPGALRRNLLEVRRHAPRSRIWAVVKAQAYGHGLEAAMLGFAQADGLAVIEFEAAQRLRELGWSRPILMLEGPFETADCELAAHLDLTLVVHDRERLEWLRAYRGPALAVYLKLNTGLNRLGIPAQSARAVHGLLRSFEGVRSVSLMTHFANSDLPQGADEALAEFERCTQGLEGERSLSNSAAVWKVPTSHADWVRPGIVLYGASPFAGYRPEGLSAAMTLRSELIAVQTLEPGDAVGYGSTFVAPKAMRIGIVACGYADGYPRHAPTGTPVLVDGQRSRLVGRVSMDMLAVDLSGLEASGVGSPVELWGASLSVDEVAAAAGTIGYELLCALAPRVRREILPLAEPGQGAS